MDKHREACELLYRHWATGTQLDALPDALRPQTRAEGYAIQACIEEFSRQPLYGWKIAATSVNGQRHIGVDGPLAGRILAERVIENGGAFQLGTSLMRVAELEFAFRMGRDLPPRASEYTQDEVLAAVATLHPAIELPDSRFAHFETAGLAQLVADNACAHFFLLGAPADDSWRKLDLASHPGKAFRNGALAEEGVGANVLGDPRIALTWLANELSRHGMTLKAGQVVTTGTCVKPVVIAVGDHIEGDLGMLGRVDVRIA
ncbi:MAG: fumarylacetoacetate hydrolase family protein [Alphaproteobacteria bacterium]